MAVTDGYLRQGADVLQALGRADGLLFLAGPDTGTPGTISASGTLSIAVTLTGRESVTDAGTLAVTTAHTATEALAASDLLAITALLTGLSPTVDLPSPGGYVILPGHGLIRWAVPAGRRGDHPTGARLSGPDGQPITSPATRTGRIITDA